MYGARTPLQTSGKTTMAGGKRVKRSRPAGGKGAESLAKPIRARVVRKVSRAESTAIPPKITFPHPANIYLRERLFDLLDRARQDHRVIWVSAPGGAGKTSLAASYLGAHKLPVLWYQVDQGDGDIASFFYYMGLAAKQAAPRYKYPLPVLTPEYLGDIPTFTRNFFRELYRRLPKNSVLVLDNYQDAPEDSLLHDVLHIAMSEAPEGMNLFVLSRVEPSAVLARLRLCDHAACLDWDKMQLTPEETAGISVMRLGKLAPSGDTLTALHERAHGWAAGLVLMLEQARDGDAVDATQAPVNQQLLFDYFAGETLSRCDPAVRDFLIKTALFPKVTVAAAQALTGIGNAQDILDDLTRRNYFTVRNASQAQDSYEYHPLFREFLRAQAQVLHSPVALDALRREAAHFLVQAGEVEEAAALFQQSQSWAELANLICANAPALIAQGRYQTVRAWIARLPEPLYEQEPWILLWHGAAWQPFDLPRARVLYERAYARFKVTDDMAGLWLSWSGIVETYIFEWARFAPLDHWIAEFYALMAQDKTPPTPELMGRAVVGIFTALMYRQPGHADLPKWVAQLEAMLHQGLDPVAMTTIGVQLLTYYSFWTGDMARAHAVFALVAPVAGRSELPPLAAIAWHVSEAIHGWMTAENDRCVAAARRGLEIARESGVHLFDIMLRIQETNGLVTAGRMEEAAHALDHARNALIPSRLMDASYVQLMLATLSFGAEGARQARVHSEQCLYLAREAGCPWAVGQALGYAVWTSVRVGDNPAAEEYLREAKVITHALGSELTDFVIHYSEWYMRSTKGDPHQTLTALRQTWALARKLGVVNWLSWPYPETAQFCTQALAHDIDTDYVRALVKKRGLPPPANEVVPDSWPFSDKLHTLGRFTVTVRDKPLPSSGKLARKPLDLLKLLVSAGPRGMSTEQAIETLWPEQDMERSYQSYSMALHRLRKLLGMDESILSQDSRVVLNARHVWVDAWAFERSLESRGADGDTWLERAVALYEGAFLGEAAAELWALVYGERLYGKYLRAVLKLGQSRQTQGAFEHAIELYQNALEHDDLQESLHQRLLVCYAETGRRADGLRAYERCRKRLQEALGVTPSAQTEALRAQLLKGNPI